MGFIVYYTVFLNCLSKNINHHTRNLFIEKTQLDIHLLQV